MGPIGPVGPQGPAGPAGASGVVATSVPAGVGLPNPGPGYNFLAPQAQVTIADGQKIFVTSQRVFGTLTGADQLTLYICYRLTTTTNATPTGGSATGLSLAANAKAIWGMSWVITGLPAGTYGVGLCGTAPSNAWNSNGSGQTTAFVF